LSYTLVLNAARELAAESDAAVAMMHGICDATGSETESSASVVRFCYDNVRQRFSPTNHSSLGNRKDVRPSLCFPAAAHINLYYCIDDTMKSMLKTTGRPIVLNDCQDDRYAPPLQPTYLISNK